MSKGKLRIMGQIEVNEPDAGKCEYKYALLIEFDSPQAIRQAMNDERCEFVFED